MKDRDGLPIKRDDEIDHYLPRRLCGGWLPARVNFALVRGMTISEKSMVEARAAAFELALEPHNDADRMLVEASLLAMFGGFRSFRQEGEDVSASAKVAAAVLAPFPLWAIEKACMQIAQGHAGLDKRWAPNDSQVVEVVEDVVKPYREALSGAKLLLAAPVRGPDAKLTPRSERPTYDNLKARCAADGLVIGTKTSTPPLPDAERDALLERYGVSREAWDAIPEAKP